MCDCKSLVEALKNLCCAYVGIRTIQSAVADLERKDKWVLASWIPGHSNVPGNDLADAEAKAGSLAELSSTAPDVDAHKAIIQRENGLPSFTHPGLLQLYAAMIKEIEEIALANRPESAVCRLCGEEEELAEDLGLRCQNVDATRHRLDLGRSVDEFVRLTTASLALQQQ